MYRSATRISFAFVALAVASAAGTALSQERVREVKEGVTPAGEAGSHYRAKEVLGAKVHVEGDTAVGTVDDIVIDDNGNVDYLIVITNDKKLVTVPWDAAKFDTKKRLATVNIAREKFEKIPTYSTTKYPVFSAPEYRNQTYKYYGLTPAQERRAIRRAP